MIEVPHPTTASQDSHSDSASRQLTTELDRRDAPVATRGSVLQDWLTDLTLMQQTVLLTSLRGADAVPKHHVSKYLLRWYRRCVLLSAFDRCVLEDPHDPRGGSFTGPIETDSLDKLASNYLRAVDELPHHFHLHLVHAAEILGFKHPNEGIRGWWHQFYLAAVRDMHLHPESERELDIRLGDNLDDWHKFGGEGEPISGQLSRETSR